MFSTRNFTGLLLLGALASCHHNDPSPAATDDFTYAGELQNFTELQFTSQVAGATAYEWTFGDGTTATQANPNHVFRRAGTYQVQLRATKLSGPVNVTKSLTLVQADTVSILIDRIVGRYRVQKRIREYQWSGAYPPVRTITRLPDTIMQITRQSRTISLGGYNMMLVGPINSLPPSPWPTPSLFPNYFFCEYPIPSSTHSNYGWLNVQQQGDSLIFRRRKGRNGEWTEETFYGRKMP